TAYAARSRAISRDRRRRDEGNADHGAEPEPLTAQGDCLPHGTWHLPTTDEKALGSSRTVPAARNTDRHAERRGGGRRGEPAREGHRWKSGPVGQCAVALQLLLGRHRDREYLLE